MQRRRHELGGRLVGVVVVMTLRPVVVLWSVVMKIVPEMFLATIVWLYLIIG